MEADQLLLKVAHLYVTIYLFHSQNNYLDNAISPYDADERSNSVAPQFGMQRNFISERCDLA